MILTPFFYLVIFLFGLAVGSFLNCIIYRLEENKSFLRGRSFCPNCKHSLRWQDLIPIFSFLVLKGKCRYCQQKISLQYPLVEFFTGILFILALRYSSPNLLLATYWLLIISFLIIIFVYDLKHFIIPDKVIYPATLITLIFNFQFLFSGQASVFKYAIFTAIWAAAFFLVIVLISRGKWMGLGDVKLAFFMGLFLGFPNIIFALFSAFFLGAIIGIGLIISGKRTLKSEVPFGPFLVTGTLLSLFFGEKIINWYLTLFL